MVSQPNSFKVDLFPHQLASIYNMEELEREKMISKDNYVKETTIGILADETGYGKTNSIIGLILRNKMEWELDVPYVLDTVVSEAGGRIKKRYIKRYDKIGTTLILMSLSIIRQWIDELKHTDLKYISITTRKAVDNIDPHDYDIILVSPTMFNRVLLSNPNIAWKRFIYDEPGHLRIPGMLSVIAGFYWFITATPYSIITQHRYCKKSFMKEIVGRWWMFDSIFSDLILKNDTDFVKASFEMPATHHVFHTCHQPLFNAVNGFVSITVNTMIAAGNIEGAITALGGGHTGNIIELVKRKKLEELEEIVSKIRIYTIRGNIERIDEWIVKKTHVDKQIQEIDKRFDEILKGNCNICLEKIIDPVLEPKCQNIFCGRCLLKWLQTKQTCPLCRSTVKSTDLIYIKTGEDEKTKTLPNLNRQIMTKPERIIDILRKKKDGKFLIFSSYDNTFRPICSLLKENNISYAEIKGSLNRRYNNLYKFKKGDIQVVFLNSNFNGSGINIQETTDIILYHEMSTCTINQILGRANRIGRKHSLYVHHLEVQV